MTLQVKAEDIVIRVPAAPAVTTSHELEDSSKGGVIKTVGNLADRRPSVCGLLQDG